MRKVEAKEAKERLDELLDEAAGGADIVIERGDGAAFRLVPVLKRRIAGLHPGAIVASEDFDEPLPDDFWLGETESPGDEADEVGT
jgi:antitoxin (DNA-binding transcriptional repressor) of toxin-antitoxin stability system